MPHTTNVLGERKGNYYMYMSIPLIHPTPKDSTPLYRLVADSTTLLNCGAMHRGTRDLSDIMSHLLGSSHKMNSFYPDEMKYCSQNDK
jgi:hypothetical protein